MTLIEGASAYLTLNLLLLGGAALCAVVHHFLPRFPLVNRRQQLKFSYYLLTVTLIFSLGQVFLPKKDFFQPPVKVWSASSSKNFDHEFSPVSAQGYLRFNFFPPAAAVNTRVVNFFFFLAGMMALLLGLYKLFRDLKNLKAIIQKSFLIRKFKSVEIFSSDFITVPFSFWVPGQQVVVVPNILLGHGSDLKIAVLHELQHHRQRDTRWVLVLWALGILCYWNPAIYFWNKYFLEIQEFACDEALIDQEKVSSEAYATCLVRVAETAIGRKENFVCATGLTFMTDRHSLSRRISTMFNANQNGLKRKWAVLLLIVVTASFGLMAFASQNLIQDRRVSLKEAQALLFTSKDDFPVVVNDLVVKQLNRFVGTPEGRDYMRKSLLRMENYKALVERKLQQYGAPEELAAVPIIESGYQNLEQEGTSPSAGLWQFISSTAINFGLQVDGNRDQRLDTEVETDAAMRYLTANNLRFKDWGLAVFAYNVGETRVQELIKKVGSRDVWTIIRAGYEDDADYLAKVMAAILIMKNPSLIQ